MVSINFDAIAANSFSEKSIDISACKYISRPYVFVSLFYPSDPKYFNVLAKDISTSTIIIRASNAYTSATNGLAVNVLCIGAI